MWNKKRDEEPQRPSYSPPTPPPASPAPVHNPTDVRKETAPMSSMPPARFEPENRGGAATIGKAVKVVGQIFSREDLYVDGDVEGTIEALEHKLTVGPNGTVQATVKAREVVALGSIKGNGQDRNPQGREADRRHPDGPHHHRRRRLFQGQHRYREAGACEGRAQGTTCPGRRAGTGSGERSRD